MKQQRVADSFAYPPRLMELERAAAYVADQMPVRVIGTPFVPNTNPRER